MDEKKENLAKFGYSITFATQLGFMVILPMLVSIFVGLKIDKVLHTKPLALIFFLLLGLIFSAHSAYKWLLPIIEK